MKEVVFDGEIVEFVKISEAVEDKFYVGVSLSQEIFIFRKIALHPNTHPYMWRVIYLTECNDASFTSKTHPNINNCLERFRDDYGPGNIKFYEFETFEEFLNWAWANYSKN